jgi:aminoglycoside/choline kinase family phosphotransferase
MTSLADDYFAERMAQDPDFAAACKEAEAEYHAESERIRSGIAPLTKRDWILLALKKSPMDRIHLMKALFLVWHRTGCNAPGYFQFQPYLYGPCSKDVYATLDQMLTDNLIVQPPHSAQRWANYYLTRQGQALSTRISERYESGLVAVLNEVVEEVSELDFDALLRRVYREAPEFAVQTVVRSALP